MTEHGAIRTPIRLAPRDADRFVRLRRRMLEAAPWAFAATLDDDEALDPARVADALGHEHRATFAIEAPGTEQGADPSPATPELVATASLWRARPPKFDHRARIWGVYVEPAFRGRGLGRAVLTAAVDLARTWRGVDFVDLGVSESSPEARRLYERLGFRAWGREPEATQQGGRRHDEIHMTLELRR